MPEFPEFESSLQDSDSHLDRNAIRRAMEPIPILDAADSVTLQIDILKETYEEILRVLEENELEREEGLRTLLLSGLGYMDAKLKLDGVNREALSGAGRSQQQVDAMVKDLAAYHSMYSVMKFKAYKLYKLNQTLLFNVSGLRATERMWEGWAERMRNEHAEMRAEVIRLRALMSEFKLDWDPGTPAKSEVAVEEPPEVDPIQIRLEALDGPPVEDAEPLSPLPPPGAGPKPGFWERVKRFFGG